MRAGNEDGRNKGIFLGRVSGASGDSAMVFVSGDCACETSKAT